MMPDREETHADRGDQLATLASVIHERSTEAALGELIAKAEKEALKDERDIAVVREARKSYACRAVLATRFAPTPQIKAQHAFSLSSPRASLASSPSAAQLRPHD